MKFFALDDGEDIIFLSLDDIHFLHELALKTGGREGNLKIQDLESALGRPQNAHFYEHEDDLITLAAYLWHGVSSAHGYQDANKRTALLAALTFLEAMVLRRTQMSARANPGYLLMNAIKTRVLRFPFWTDIYGHAVTGSMYNFGSLILYTTNPRSFQEMRCTPAASCP